jgi:hypothetical protein
MWWRGLARRGSRAVRRQARESSDKPMLKAFCRVAPSERFNFLAILPAGVFLRAIVFISRTSTAVQERLFFPFFITISLHERGGLVTGSGLKGKSRYFSRFHRAAARWLCRHAAGGFLIHPIFGPLSARTEQLCDFERRPCGAEQITCISSRWGCFQVGRQRSEENRAG